MQSTRRDDKAVSLTLESDGYIASLRHERTSPDSASADANRAPAQVSPTIVFYRPNDGRKKSIPRLLVDHFVASRLAVTLAFTAQNLADLITESLPICREWTRFAGTGV